MSSTMPVLLSVAGPMRLAAGARVVPDERFGGPQPRLVAALLLLEPERCWSPGDLAMHLWPRGVPDHWRPALRGLVSRVRGVLGEAGVGAGAVVHRAGRYHVQIPGLSVDTQVARREVEQAAAALRRHRYAEGDELAAAACGVLAREVLPGLGGAWVEEQRDAARRAETEGLLLRGRAARGLGRWVSGRQALRLMLARSPYREDAWRELIRLEAAAGNVAEAVRIWEQCREVLLADLGVTPDARTQQVAQDLLGRLEPTAARARP